MAITIGQRILTQTICHHLAISEDRAWELHVRGRKLDPSWEVFGEKLLGSLCAAPGTPTIGERLMSVVIGFRLEVSTESSIGIFGSRADH
jgi:hypothetical protein